MIPAIRRMSPQEVHADVVVKRVVIVIGLLVFGGIVSGWALADHYSSKSAKFAIIWDTVVLISGFLVMMNWIEPLKLSSPVQLTELQRGILIGVSGLFSQICFSEAIRLVPIHLDAATSYSAFLAMLTSALLTLASALWYGRTPSAYLQSPMKSNTLQVDLSAINDLQALEPEQTTYSPFMQRMTQQGQFPKKQSPSSGMAGNGSMPVSRRMPPPPPPPKNDLTAPQ